MTDQTKNNNGLKIEPKDRLIELLIILVIISILLDSYLMVYEAMSSTLRFDLEIQILLIKKLLIFNNQ